MQTGVSKTRALALAWVCGVCVAHAATGPLLSDTNLFAALNLDAPGLGSVKDAVALGDYAAARAGLADYLRTRTNVTWFFDPRAVTNAVSYSLSLANATATGTITVSSIPYTFPDGNIDWFFNATTNPASGYAPNNEWLWQLNRMMWWPNLGQTYWGRSRDEAYAQAWVNQLRDWIADCPAQASRQNVAGSAWRTIETGLRMSTYWPDAYHRFLTSPSVTDADLVLYLTSCIEQARYLAAFYTQANFLTMEMSGLYTVGALYPELKEAAAWRSFAAAKLQAEQTVQFLPDGWHYELAPGYHMVAIDNTLRIHQIAALEGLLPELPANYLAGLENAYQALLYMAAPNRVTPPVNDSGRNDVRSRLREGYATFTNRLDFLWLATGGTSGVAPAATSYSFPYGGFNVMRSGWKTNAHFACFDAGALGQSGHRHEDKLALQLWCHGREILFDHGAGNYETSAWRSYSMSSLGHNTVAVDGLEQKGGDGNSTLPDPDYVATNALPMRWESDVARDFAAGTYNRGYSNYTFRPAVHTRRVLFAKPDLFLVADTLAPASPAVPHTYEARWNLLPTNTVLDAATRTVSTADAGLANLAVVPCLTDGLAVSNTVAKEAADYRLLLGWKVQSGTTTHVPCTTVTHTRTGTGTNHFLTLFVPLAPGATNPVAQVVATGATSADLLLRDGRTLKVSADPNPARGLRLVELDPSGATNRAVGAGFVPPAITPVQSLVMLPNRSRTVSVTVSDPDAPAAALAVSGASDNPALLPAAGIAVSGSGAARTVTLTPAASASGQTTVVLTVADPDGATASTAFRLTVDAPPAPLAAATASTLEEASVDFDLRAYVADDLTPVSNLLFSVSGATGGTATLDADGYTVHFLPASNFCGSASVAFSARDTAADPRLLLHYDFEQPALATNVAVADRSGNSRDSTLETFGSGAALPLDTTPAALARVTRQSLLLREQGNFNGARFRRSIATNEFSFSDRSWTFSGWFNRQSQTNEDFILYLGKGDGFGANEELHLYGYPNAATVGVRHYVGETTTDVDLSATGVATGTWHHVALTFARTAERTGVLSFYLDGQLKGSDNTLTFNLDQSVPVTFGGHYSPTFAVTRWFNGYLDDLAVFSEALSSEEIAALATASVGHFGGQSAALTATVHVADINDPPDAAAGRAFTRLGTPVEIDLRTLAADLESSAAAWRFTLSAASNGTVVLLADGHTARFTPKPGHTGAAGFTFAVRDAARPTGALLHYAFEPPDAADDGFAADASGSGRDGALAALGAGGYAYDGASPFPLDSAAALRLTQPGTAGAARLTRSLPAAEHNLSDADWSFAGWFRRDTRSDDDFLFYLGSDNGFGGGGDELQLFCPSGADTLRLYHFNSANVQDLGLASGATALTGQWHHAALTFTRTNASAGVVRAYLDGQAFGAPTAVAWSLKQDRPLVFGGHASAGSYERMFSGWLDDLVLYARVLSASEIAAHAARAVVYASGLSASNRVAVSVLSEAERPALSAPADGAGGWRMTVSGPAGATFTVFASTNLTDWSVIDTFTAPQSPFPWSDPASGLWPQRFYRVEVSP